MLLPQLFLDGVASEVELGVLVELHEDIQALEGELIDVVLLDREVLEE